MTLPIGSTFCTSLACFTVAGPLTPASTIIGPFALATASEAFTAIGEALLQTSNTNGSDQVGALLCYAVNANGPWNPLPGQAGFFDTLQFNQGAARLRHAYFATSTTPAATVGTNYFFSMCGTYRGLTPNQVWVDQANLTLTRLR